MPKSMTRSEAKMIAEELYLLFRPRIEKILEEAVREETDEYIDSTQAAEMLGWSVHTLYNRIKDVPHVKLGKKLRFSKRSLHEFIRR